MKKWVADAQELKKLKNADKIFKKCHLIQKINSNQNVNDNFHEFLIFDNVFAA